MIFIYFFRERINITVNNKITVTGANKVFLIVAVVNIIYSLIIAAVFFMILYIFKYHMLRWIIKIREFG